MTPVTITDSCRTPLPTPSFTVRVENDSVHVEGATLYSCPLVIPLNKKGIVLPESDYDQSQFEGGMYEDTRRICLQFMEPINAYNVKAILIPDEKVDSVGLATWIFSRGQKEIRINTSFCWDWREEVKDQIRDGVKYQNETFTVLPSPNMVQGQDSTIIDTPFCFKDVDFDGKLEFCFRDYGICRYYYAVYKKVPSSCAKLMTGRPYNNIVHSDIYTTVFNYKNRTIHLVDEDGATICEHWYKTRPIVHDVLNPMQHIRGVESNYSGGARNDDYFEKGRWVKSHIEFRIDSIDGYADSEIEAEYMADGDNSLTLRTVKLHDCDNEIWQVLYNKEEPIQL